MRKKRAKLMSRILYGLGRVWSRFPFVEIWSVHLGHTIFESAHFLQHRPLLTFWRKPAANFWLVEKLSAGVRFPRLQIWMSRKLASKRPCTWVDAAKAKMKIFSDQYYLMNLGFNCLPPRLPKISFTDEEAAEARAFFQSHGLEKGKYVCFCIRDESYYLEFKPDLNFGPNSNFEFRNAKVANYAAAAKYLRKKGITPVLMGFSTLPASDVFFRPALCPDFRPWIEAVLFRDCLFCVGMMTGTTLYASLFRRPVLWSDAFWRGAPVGGRQDLVLPKKILRRSSSTPQNRRTNYTELHLEEWVRLGPPPDNDWSHFSKKGYECEACSPEEILEAVKDMVTSLHSKKLFPSREARALHKEFSRIHLSATKQLGHPPTRLAPSWAKANGHLLKVKYSLYKEHWLEKTEKAQTDMVQLFEARQTKKYLCIKNKFIPRGMPPIA